MQRYFAVNKCNDKMILDVSDLHHICNVMRMKSGEFIEVVFEHVLYRCKVVIDNDVSVVIDSVIDSSEDSREIVLVVPVLKEQKMDLVLQKATELGVSRIIPIIDNVSCISSLNFSEGVKLVCSTRENEKNLKNVMHNIFNCAKMYIVVGPEGGLSIEEEKKLNDLGFVSISLGKRIMRVETVPLFVLSILNYELME